MAVLVLQALAEQRRASGGGAEQEPAGARVGGLPDEVADALEAEHRIERVERHGRGGVRGVRRAGGDEARRRAGLGDALLEDLAGLRLGVAEQQVVVDRLVQLALRGVDLQLREQRVHAERAALVGDDRHDVLAELGVAGEVAQQAGEAHRRRHGLAAGALAQLGEGGVVGQRGRLAVAHDALGDRAAERPAPLHHVLVLDRVLAPGGSTAAASPSSADSGISSWRYSRSRRRSSCSLFIFLIWWVALRPSMSGPSVQPLIVLHRIAVGAPGAEVLGGRLVGGVQLAVVVAAAGQVDEVLVAEVGDHLAQARIGTEEVVADVVAGLGAVALELAVDGGVQLVEQHAVLVVGEQLVPLRAEDHLDDVPAGAAEHRLELLDDLAVAAHRAVEALQVAVDDEDRGCRAARGWPAPSAPSVSGSSHSPSPRNAHTRLWLVSSSWRVEQVAVVAGLVEGGDRAEAHAHRRELPEVGHQPRVRVARQAAAVAADLAAEVVEVVGLEAALEERPGVDAGGGVALEVDRGRRRCRRPCRGRSG